MSMSSSQTLSYTSSIRMPNVSAIRQELLEMRGLCFLVHSCFSFKQFREINSVSANSNHYISDVISTFCLSGEKKRLISKHHDDETGFKKHALAIFFSRFYKSDESRNEVNKVVSISGLRATSWDFCRRQNLNLPQIPSIACLISQKTVVVKNVFASYLCLKTTVSLSLFFQLKY